MALLCHHVTLDAFPNRTTEQGLSTGGPPARSGASKVFQRTTPSTRINPVTGLINLYKLACILII